MTHRHKNINLGVYVQTHLRASNDLKYLFFLNISFSVSHTLVHTNKNKLISNKVRLLTIRGMKRLYSIPWLQQVASKQIIIDVS